MRAMGEGQLHGRGSSMGEIGEGQFHEGNGGRAVTWEG